MHTHYDTLTEYRQLSKTITKIVLENGKPVEHTVRMPVGSQSVVIDALNVVVDSETFDKDLKAKFTNPDYTKEKRAEIAWNTAYHIAYILSVTVSADFNEIYDLQKGANFYEYSYRIGSPDEPLGLICLNNAKSDTILIMFYGAGCHYANDKWEHILHGYLTHFAVNPKITRIDLALDDFNGDYSGAELANLADTEGKFALTNKKPQVQHLGDWKRHEGRGRTLQVGKREGGKLYRGYEKGKQLGDKESLWFRHEVELSNKNRLIPLDVLDPTNYFKGCYPYCAELLVMAGNVDVRESRIKIIEKTVEISYEKSKQILKHQYGKYLKVYRDYHSDKDILDMLVTDKAEYYPKRLAMLCKLKSDMPIIYKNHIDRKTKQENLAIEMQYKRKPVTFLHVPKRELKLKHFERVPF